MTIRFHFVAILLIVASCTKPEKLQPHKGYVPVKGGKIWYSVTGTGKGTPVILLHGGPGYPSYYLKPLLALGKDRPVIRFDQLGCGRSGTVSDTTLMTVDAHIDQVRTLLDSLGIREFYLYGHSWGTMLATSYYFKYPEGIKGIILASPCLDAKRWVADADTLIDSLPDSTAIVLKNLKKDINQDSAKIYSAVDIYFANFYNRRLPVSADVDSSGKYLGTEVYEYMWGPSEFHATGTLKTFDVTDQLKTIDIPVLFTTGQYDAARPETVQYYQHLTPESKLVIISNAGHATMQDNPAEDLQAITTFLNDIEKRN